MLGRVLSPMIFRLIFPLGYFKIAATLNIVNTYLPCVIPHYFSIACGFRIYPLLEIPFIEYIARKPFERWK